MTLFRKWTIAELLVVGGPTAHAQGSLTASITAAFSSWTLPLVNAHKYGQKPGKWRYNLNGPQIYHYQKDRLRQSARYESVYTMGKYYRLGHTAKPEHLGGVRFSAAETNQCLVDYQQITAGAKALRPQVAAALQDAYFELILYPTQGARLMNEKVAYAARSLELALTGDEQALLFAQRAQAAYDQIQARTRRYNGEITGGN